MKKTFLLIVSSLFCVVATVFEHPATRAYRLDGSPASDTTRGIIIEGGQKVVRR